MGLIYNDFGCNQGLVFGNLSRPWNITLKRYLRIKMLQNKSYIFWRLNSQKKLVKWHLEDLTTTLHCCFFPFSESPVPLEFTPVLGILIGVVVTLLLVAFVIMLILRLKYKNTSTRNKQQQNQTMQRRGSNNSNNGGCRSRKADPDDEEYFCLRWVQ